MNLGGAIRINKTGFLIIIIVIVLLTYLYSNKTAEKDVRRVSLQKLLETAIKASKNGGAEVVAAKDHLKIENKGKTREGVDDSVTTADYNSHCAMVATLKHNFPTVKVISEETKSDCDSSKVDVSLVQFSDANEETVDENDVVVWIDPLDATKEYTEKLYKYVTTMVCVSVRGEPVIGVIHNPFLNQTSWAWVGKEKFINIKQSVQPNSGDNIKIIISKSHSGDLSSKLEKDIKDKIEIISAAGAGYKSLQVATREVDAYIHVTAIKKWDLCAGNAIINALGGKFITKEQKTIDYSDVVNVKNEKGVIATFKDPDIFLKML